MMRVSLIVLSFLVSGFSTWGVALAEPDGAARREVVRAEKEIPWTTITVRVVGDGGKPVENATVRPCGYRTAVGVAKKMEPLPVKTDAQGLAAVRFPRATFWTEWQRLFEIHLVVTDPRYCHQKFVLDTTNHFNEIPELKVRPGVRIRVGGFEAGQDQPLKNCRVLLENRDSDEPDFVELADGWLQSAPLPPERRWFRLVHIAEDGSLRFGNHRAWDPEDGQDQVIRVDVKPGVRLAGRLSENVARPITRGRVVVWCAPPHRLGSEKPVEATESSWWIDSTTIAPDGTFEFRSLPNGYVAQLYAVANDSFSTPANDEVIEQSYQWLGVGSMIEAGTRPGHIVRLTQSTAELTLQMKPAGTARVKVVNSQGKPIPDVVVHSCPAQMVIGLNLRSSALYCLRRSTLEELLGTYVADLTTNSPFVAVTDADGAATIHELPSGFHRIFATKGQVNNGQGQETHFQSGRTVEVSVVLPMK